MTPTAMNARRTGILVSILLLFAVSVSAQTAREQMWPAPTAEDWKKPVAITFQRTWEDALAVSRETKKPILICVNMDGEIASEHYAGIRYRQPDIAKLYEPYVCVIASTYRHTPHDHDENGERIPCPRFGSVTCGEHISIEPILYEKYMEGQRVAPRHICVELDGTESYDVFYAFDTDSVFKAIEEGITKKNRPTPIVKGDRTIIEKVASRDVKDRAEVEAAYRKGDKETRRSLLRAALELGENAPAELLRLGLFGFDEEMSAMARKALLQSASPGTTDLISEALAVPLDSQEREALIGALDRLGKKDARARKMAQAHRGLDAGSSGVKTDTYRRAVKAGATYKPATSTEVAGAMRDQNAAYESNDPAQRLKLARAFLDRGLASPVDSSSARRVREALLGDAVDAARATLELDAKSWGAHAVLAVSSYYLGDKEQAFKNAHEAAALNPDEPQSRHAMIVMGLVAEHRRNQISDAVRDKKDWPRSWLSDLHAAYNVLADHPHGDASQVWMHYEFLMWLGAWRKASSALNHGLERFPSDSRLHAAYRKRILRRYGVKRLESAYRKMLESENAHPSLRLYAGYASLIAAEYHRRAGRLDEALGAYDRAIALYEEAIAADEAFKLAGDHDIAMAHGGKARIYYEKKDDERSVKAIFASLERREAAAATLDGLNMSTADTAKMVRSRLKEQKKTKLLTALEERLKKLPPELMQLPAYEFGPPGQNNR